MIPGGYLHDAPLTHDPPDALLDVFRHVWQVVCLCQQRQGFVQALGVIGLQRAGTSITEKLVEVWEDLIEALQMVAGMDEVWQIIHGCDDVGSGAVAAPEWPHPKQACICCITDQALEVRQVHHSLLNVMCNSQQPAKDHLYPVLLLLYVKGTRWA